MDQEKIGKFILKKRKEQHLTQEQLAEQLGVSKNAVSKWERGICLMDISLLEPLSNLLHISIVELLNGEEIIKKDSKEELDQYSQIVLKFSKEKIAQYKRKIMLSALFLLSLLPMLANQYGGARGVQEISGIINLTNPIGMIATLLFFVGVWYPFKQQKYSTFMGGIGLIGMVLSELLNFFTWYIPNYRLTIDFHHSLQNVFIEFYIGLFVSILAVILYFFLTKKK